MTLRRILAGILCFLAVLLTLQIKDRRMDESRCFYSKKYTAYNLRFGDEWLRMWCRRAAFPFLP